MGYARGAITGKSIVVCIILAKWPPRVCERDELEQSTARRLIVKHHELHLMVSVGPACRVRREERHRKKRNVMNEKTHQLWVPVHHNAPCAQPSSSNYNLLKHATSDVYPVSVYGTSPDRGSCHGYHHSPITHRKIITQHMLPA
jgi:hypothetical protein